MKKDTVKKVAKATGYGITIAASTVVKIYGDIAWSIAKNSVTGVDMIITGVKDRINEEEETTVIEDIFSMYGINIERQSNLYGL